VANVWSTGPVLIWVGIGDLPPIIPPDSPGALMAALNQPGAAGLGVIDPAAPVNSSALTSPRPGYRPRLLGTCVKCPQPHFTPYHRPVESDAAGEAADDIMFKGEEALIFADLNFFNEDVYAALQSRPNFRSVRGAQTRSDTGALLVRSGLTYPVWLQFTWGNNSFVDPLDQGTMALKHATFPPFAIDSLPPGYRFLNCYLRSDLQPQTGTRYRVLSLTWHAVRGPEPEKYGQTPGAVRPRLLYDHNMRELPPLFTGLTA
jgi:hypothetical protein